MSDSIYMQVSLIGDVKWEQEIDVPTGLDPASFAKNLADAALEGLKVETNVDTGNLQSNWQVMDADAGHILLENDTDYAIYVNDGNEPRAGASVATIPPPGFQYVEHAMDNIDDYISQAAANADELSPEEQQAEEPTTAFSNLANRYIDTGESLADVLGRANANAAATTSRLLARFGVK